MASRSSLITHLDPAQAEEEVQCSKILVGEMKRDARATFSKSDAIIEDEDEDEAGGDES